MSLGIVLQATANPCQSFSRALRLVEAWQVQSPGKILIACLGESACLAVDNAPCARTLRSIGLRLAESSACEFLVCPSALRQRGLAPDAIAAPFLASTIADILLRWQACARHLELA